MTGLSDAQQRLADFRRQSDGPTVRPRDAATLILLDRTGPVAKVLMGRRHTAHVFMPGKYVFPGGRVEPSDARMTVATPLSPETEARLLKEMRRPSPGHARAVALAAVRETFEETGLLLGKRTAEAPPVPAESWRGFADAKVRPDLSELRFIARAITPPGRVRRFDARFFAADAAAVAQRLEGFVGEDAEFVELAWVPIPAAKKLNLPTITEVVLEELEAQLADGFAPGQPVPFYRVRGGRFRREML